MAKERLSKLQKWILKKCLKDLTIHYRDAFVFFSKKYSGGQHKVKFGERWTKKELTKLFKKSGEDINDYEFVDYKYKKGWYEYSVKGWRPRESLVITKSEQAVISRSLKGLAKKGLLIQPRKWAEYSLTKEGFLKANITTRRWSKANKIAMPCSRVSFKEYQKKIAEKEKERQRTFEKMTETIKNLMPKR